MSADSGFRHSENRRLAGQPRRALFSQPIRPLGRGGRLFARLRRSGRLCLGNWRRLGLFRRRLGGVSALGRRLAARRASARRSARAARRTGGRTAAAISRAATRAAAARLAALDARRTATRRARAAARAGIARYNAGMTPLNLAVLGRPALTPTADRSRQRQHKDNGISHQSDSSLEARIGTRATCSHRSPFYGWLCHCLTMRGLGNMGILG